MKNKCKCIDVALIVNLSVNLSFQIIAKDAEKQQQQQQEKYFKLYKIAGIKHYLKYFVLKILLIRKQKR